MIRLLFVLGMMGLSAGAGAQVIPRSDGADPRLQTIGWVEGREVTLTAMPLTGLTVMLEPGEKVVRIAIEDEQHLKVQVSAEKDSFLLLPQSDLNGVRVRVQTDRRTYPFRVQTEVSLLAAYLVRFTYGSPDKNRNNFPPSDQNSVLWTYRFKGDRSVFPGSVYDDGIRTTILFRQEQSLSAVFAIGPTGEEEVVNGYMRGEHFIIDRVYQELIFRIDDEKARAVRAANPGSGQ